VELRADLVGSLSTWNATRRARSQPIDDAADVGDRKEDEMTNTLVSEKSLVDDETATSWSEARKRIEMPEPELVYWLATVSRDGRPHVRPILGLWLDGTFHFVIAETSRKGRNLAGDPRCSLAASSTVLPSLDVIVEGDADKVSDEAEVQRVVDEYASTMDWPLEVRDGGVFGPNAPTAGPPPYAVFKLTPKTIFGLPGVAGMGEGERHSARPAGDSRSLRLLALRSPSSPGKEEP
jgi:nitroimidazol reductase NimA-like FMN-containing flavoprotein (pyridoxamine 5'-phosphate oxidase superfamily)